MIRRLTAAAAAVAIAVAPTAPALAQGHMSAEEAFVRELAVIRELPVEQLDYAGAVAVGANTCWSLENAYPYDDTTRWTPGVEADIRDAAVLWICPEVTR